MTHRRFKQQKGGESEQNHDHGYFEVAVFFVVEEVAVLHGLTFNPHRR
jgi:hypothetical protein